MKTTYMTAFDGQKSFVSIWDEVASPKGAVLIAHGMAEHSGRYDDFARFLNAEGYIVLAEDERGHRFSAEKKGVVNGDSYADTVKDKSSLINYIADNYQVKTLLLGHSYGSFVSQGYLEATSGKDIVGCILSGTAYMKNAATMAGQVIANIQAAIVGRDKPAKLLNTLSFSAYNKPFSTEGHEFAWLSRDVQQVAKYEADEFCGHLMSIGFYCSFFKGINGLYGAAASSIRKDLPIFIAVGGDDPVSRGAKDAEKLYRFYRNKGLDVSIKIYDGARHEILNETNNADVYKDMLGFINTAFGE